MIIEDLIKCPESCYLEIKSCFTSTTKLAQDIIAFANKKGGQIIIGVDDKSREVIGIDFTHSWEEWVANVVSDLTNPRPTYEIEYHTVNGKSIIVISVAEGLGKPYHLKNKPLYKGTYVRIGSTTRLSDENELRELLREGKGIIYEETTIQIAKAKDIDLNKVDKFQIARKRRFGTEVRKINRALLENLGLLHKQGDKYEATVAGLLLFGVEPQQFSQLSKAVIRCCRFRGVTKALIIDQLVADGTLDEQIARAENFLVRNIRLGSVIKGMKREDQYEYPVEAIREAVVNAVVHRAYCLENESIFFAIYDDRVEVASPGSLPSGVTLDNISEKQVSRNKIIARRMFEMGYCEEWGRGIQMMNQLMDKWGLPRPRYEELDRAFRVTFYGPGRQEAALDEVQLKIVQIAREKKIIHTRELISVFNLSRQTIIKKLRGLVNAGFLVQHGKRGQAVSYSISSGNQ